MERDLKIVFGKLLGEIYRLQQYTEDFKNPMDDARIYALRHGIESIIDEEIELMGFVSNEQETAVADVLNEIDQSKAKAASFSGYYDIENELTNRGVDRSTAIRVLKFMKADGRFGDLIAKMDSSNSPSECRRLDIKDDA